MSVRSSRTLRRIRTVPTHVLLFLLVTALTPVWLVVGLLIDVFRWVTRRHHGMAVRMFAFGWWYLFVGTWCLARLIGHWLVAGFHQELSETLWKPILTASTCALSVAVPAMPLKLDTCA